MFAFRLTFSCLITTRSLSIPMTQRSSLQYGKPSAAISNLSTSVKANALTTVEPTEEKKVLQDARTVLSCGSSLSARKDRCHRDIYNSVCCRKQNVRYICVDQHSCLSDIRDRKSNNRCHTKRNCTKQNPWS